MRAIGPDVGATRATDHRGTPRRLKRPDLELKSAFFLRVSRIFVLSFFSSPLIPFPTPDVATNGRPIETADILVAERWRASAEWRNMRPIRPDIGATGATHRSGTSRTPRSSAESHGTSEGPTTHSNPLFLRASRVFVFSFSSLSSLQVETPDVATTGRPIVTADILVAGRWRRMGAYPEWRNFRGIGPDNGPIGTADNRGNKRNPTEH